MRWFIAFLAICAGLLSAPAWAQSKRPIVAIYAILDPATGEALGNNETPYGQIQITDVQPRFSKAVAITNFATVPPVGSIVRVATAGEVNSSKKKKK